jgi:streptogramin lyase
MGDSGRFIYNGRIINEQTCQYPFSTAANRPKVVVAGKPFISFDSSQAAIPFFTNYGKEEGLSPGTIECRFTDKAGNLWFGTDGEGACAFNGKSFTRYTIDEGLTSNDVYCITQDNQGNIWFGTTSGASRYDGKAFTNYTTAQGLASDIPEILEPRYHLTV